MRLGKDCDGRFSAGHDGSAKVLKVMTPQEWPGMCCAERSFLHLDRIFAGSSNGRCIKKRAGFMSQLGFR